MSFSANLVALKNLGRIVSGSTPSTRVSEYWGGDIPWITPADLTGHEGIYFQGELRRITKAGYDSCSSQMLPTGSILFSSRAPIGHCAVTTFPMCTNQGFKSIVPNQRLDAVYGFFALKAFTPQIVAQGRGATFSEITKEILGNFRIPLPPLPEQQRIAGILAKADRLSRLRRYALELSDTYLGSVFLEMFGAEQLQHVPFEDVALKDRGAFVNGPFGSNLLTSELVSEGVPVIYIRDIRAGRYERVSEACVTPEKAKELDVCRVDAGDVLIAKVGDPPGTAAVYPQTHPPAIVTQDVIRIKVDSERATAEYLAGFMNSKVGYHTLKPIIIEATRERFGLTSLKKLVIPLPSRTAQERFATIVCKLDRLRAQQREALRQAEHLFQTLLHQAFEGELGQT